MSQWEMFCKRTEDPKLRCLEAMLDAAGIQHRRNGYSWHAPVLEVPAEQLDAAEAILAPIDDVPDDDPRWESNRCPLRKR